MKTKSLNRVRVLTLVSVAAGAIASGPMAPAAHAQALQPVVDVCTGITLPRSAVTEIIGAVNQPIVDQIETTVNDLTTVTLILDPTATITDLNLAVRTSDASKIPDTVPVRQLRSADALCVHQLVVRREPPRIFVSAASRRIVVRDRESQDLR